MDDQAEAEYRWSREAVGSELSLHVRMRRHTIYLAGRSPPLSSSLCLLDRLPKDRWPNGALCLAVSGFYLRCCRPRLSSSSTVGGRGPSLPPLAACCRDKRGRRGRREEMECLLGLLKVRVVRGVHLAICDPLTHSSDPYVVLRLGQQKVKSSIKYNTINPEWNEELTLSITNMMNPVKIELFDHDTFTKDDGMGDAEFCILDFVEIAKRELSNVPDGTVMKTIHPEKGNCFATESHITWKDGKVSQDIVLRLRNTETGELVLHLHWVNIPGVAR